MYYTAGVCISISIGDNVLVGVLVLVSSDAQHECHVLSISILDVCQLLMFNISVLNSWLVEL